jgi:hypothetical protein
LRKCLTEIKPGPHLIYYDVSYITRYYSPITVARGSNILRPKFEYFGMPGLEGDTGYEKHGKNEQTFTNSTDYSTYDDAFVKHDHKAAITLTMKSAPGTPVPASKGVKKHSTLFWTIEWEVTLDGQKISSDKLIVEHDPAATDNTEGKKDLWGDARHRYVLSYRLSNTYAHGEIQAEYAEYK